jgi:hypothetical protein
MKFNDRHTYFFEEGFEEVNKFSLVIIHVN